MTDALGNTTIYSYSTGDRLLTSTTDAAETVTNYTYNTGMEQLTKVECDGKEVTYGYNYVRLTSIGHNGFTYGFGYDQFGNTTTVKAGNHTLVTNEYLPHNGMISKSTYGNQQYVEYSYTQDEQVKQVSYNGTPAFTYRYDSAGNVTEMTDIAAGVTYYYTSDLIGRPTVMRTNHGQALQVSYDERNRTDAVISQVTNVTTETGFTYGDGSFGKPEAAITAVSIDGTNQVVYEYDNLGRLSKKTTGGEDTEYTYVSITGTDRTSTLVAGVTEDNVTTSYTYDSLGNITSIKVGNDVVKSYQYDKLGQLVRENDANNGVQGKTITYTYDAGGNITEKKFYDYTTGELGEVLETVTYGYGDNTWYDMLTSYKGQAITYDTIGNPVNYRDGMSFSWIRGRRLGTLTVDGTTTSYTYDDNGIRTSKTVGDTKTTYYLNGSSIQTQICGSTRLDFLYDEQGSVIGFKYNNGIYLYQKNLQGDIIGIENSAGTQVVAYQYDSWGKLLGIGGSEAETIGTLNPFRYRGYYYDEESGLYYLNNRYYDSETGRFISPDVLETLTAECENAAQYNLYAYCWNNPVNLMDESGAWPSWATKVLIGTAVIAAAAVLTVATAGTGTALACFAVGALKGAIAGAAIGAATGAATGAVTHRITTGSWEGAGEAALNGAADGYMSGAISGFISGGLTSNACFVAGTLVLTSEGRTAIENIKAGDVVWAENVDTGEKALKHVVQTFVNETDELVHVFVNGEEIITTPEHPFYVPKKGWIGAIHLRAGDILVLQSGEYVIVEMIQHEILESPITVYNFEVEDFHTYYVGDTNVLVHNVCNAAKNAQLPTKGKIRYVPPKGVGNNLPRTSTGGYIDRFNNIWVKGPSRTIGEAFEWDVQLSRNGKNMLGWLSRDGSHLNVSLRGIVTHR